jgi:hypothetical protein
MNDVPPIISGISKRTKRIIWGIVITIICLPVLLLVINLGYFIFISPFRVVHEADTGFRKAKNIINPEQLRAWALAEIPKHPQLTNDVIPQISNSEIPSNIQKLYAALPEDAVIQKYGDQKYVQISWGGGFFHWALLVGDTNFSLPFNSANHEYPYNFEWVPGIYYTRECNWKLR